MTRRRLVPALLFSVALVLLATLGGAARAGSLGEGSGIPDVSRILAALTGAQKLHFSGVLTQNDVPVPKGNQRVRFSIWTDLSSPDLTLRKWQEDQTVAVRNGGVINVFLGAATAFPDGLFDNSDLFLGIELLDAANAVVTTFPRQEFAHVPKAFRAVGAGKADKLDDEKCAKCVKESHVQDKVVGHEKIKDSAVRKEQLDSKAVVREKIDDKAVNKEKLEDRAVGKEKIEDKAVSKEKIGDKAVGKGQLDDKAVGKGQLEDKAVGKGQLDTGAELDGLPGYSIRSLTSSYSFGGTFRSVAATIGADGLPVIAFLGATEPSLAKCADLACTSSTINAISGLPWYPSLAILIGRNGNPLVASGSKLATCNDPACAAPATITSISPGTSAAALDVMGELVTGRDNMAIDVAGNGVTVRVAVGGGGVHAIPECLYFGPCSSPAVVLDPLGGDQIAMATSAHGGPFAVYVRGAELRYAHCDDPFCLTFTTGILDTDSTGSGISSPSVAIGRDGRPVVAYTKRPTSYGAPTLFVARCSTSDCRSASTTAAAFDSTTGFINVSGPPSVTIGRDGLPLIAFETSGQLNVLHCSNVFCVPNARAR